MDKIGHARILSDYRDGSKDWLEARNLGIGGSDAACVIGLKPYGKTRLDLWAQKRGESDSVFTGNAATEYGSAIEQYIFNRLSFDMELSIKECEYQLAHPDHYFMHANVDGLIVEDGEVTGLVEIKTSASPLNSDEPHEYHYAQIQHYLSVTGLQKCLYAYHVTPMDRELALHLAREVIPDDQVGEYWSAVVQYATLETIMVERDDQYIEKLIGHEEIFWQSVQSGEYPDEILPEGEVNIHDETLSALVEKYAGYYYEEKSYKPPSDVAKNKKILLEEVRKQCNVIVGQGGAKRIHTPAGTITWNARGYWQIKPNKPAKIKPIEDIKVPF